MFREMRRFKQQLPHGECEEILKKNSSGVLALSGDDGYPYAVPMSYVYSDGKLWFHSALTGHKVDALRRCPKASFCVIDRDDVIPERYTTEFKSVIVFGTVRELTGEEFLSAIRQLADKYAPLQGTEPREEEIRQSMGRFLMLELTAEHITGKEGIELTRRREGRHEV